MHMKFPLVIALCSSVLLGGCDDKPTDSAQNITEPVGVSAQMVAMDSLPADAPALGTDIKNLVKKSTVPTDADVNTVTIMWEDLVPDAYRPEAIMEKYMEQIEALEEGSLEELELFEKLKAEFNSAPANEQLAGKMVKIPGFVSPLDESKGMVGDFLLVPYFGSCIHSPPPPINQTVLVKPQEGKSIAMGDIYQPVWVIGEMKVESITTDLAQAGYQIENARLEMYESEDEKTKN